MLTLYQFNSRPNYNYDDIFFCTGFAAAIALSFFFSRNIIQREDEESRKLRKKTLFIVLKISFVFGFICAIVQILVFRSTCRGEECLILILEPALVTLALAIIVSIILFLLNFTFLIFLDRKIFGKFLIILGSCTCALLLSSATKWDSKCSIPGNYDREWCLVEKATTTGDLSLCRKARGRNLSGLCFKNLSQKLDNPEICRSFLGGRDKDYCLAEFIRLKKQTALCQDLHYPDIKNVFCHSESHTR